jgi:hypothetical protein
MRLPSDPRYPQVNTPNFLTQLTNLYRDTAKQLNLLTEGKIVAVTNAGTAAPTAGTYQQGDKVWHSAPVEAGSASSKYIIIGYICIAAGTPGTWREMRVLTGN